MRRSSLGRDLLVGAATGVAAAAVSGWSDRLLDRFVSEEQKKRDRKVRRGPGHEVAQKRFARRVAGADASDRSLRAGKAAFTVLYGAGWGLLYAALRRRSPAVGKAAGLPFALPFFLACDGGIAPLLGFSPGLGTVPWQMSAKELGNHAAWTASVELLSRAAKRLFAA